MSSEASITRYIAAKHTQYTSHCVSSLAMSVVTATIDAAMGYRQPVTTTMKRSTLDGNMMKMK